ncbi:MAG: hypothetical protein RQ966_13375, partial [Acetobacteraceae bacterium]|nr:hypothetical protein [Acetobacteraceae bacterium]
VGWKALVAFSDFLGLPKDISGVTPKFVISEQEIQVFHALCDPANVRPITKSHFEDAMNSVLEHIDQDRKEATLAGLVRVAPGAAPGSDWRQLEGLLDTARVPVVSEAVKLSTDIEAIAANDTSKQIELLQDSNNPTRYDRLVAVSEVAFAQPPKPGTNDRISPQEFVSDLAGLQSDGRADLVRDVLDGNPIQTAGCGRSTTPSKKARRSTTTTPMRRSVCDADEFLHQSAPASGQI